MVKSGLARFNFIVIGFAALVMFIAMSASVSAAPIKIASTTPYVFAHFNYVQVQTSEWSLASTNNITNIKYHARLYSDGSAIGTATVVVTDLAGKVLSRAEAPLTSWTATQVTRQSDGSLQYVTIPSTVENAHSATIITVLGTGTYTKTGLGYVKGDLFFAQVGLVVASQPYAATYAPGWSVSSELTFKE